MVSERTADQRIDERVAANITTHVGHVCEPNLGITSPDKHKISMQLKELCGYLQCALLSIIPQQKRTMDCG